MAALKQPEFQQNDPHCNDEEIRQMTSNISQANTTLELHVNQICIGGLSILYILH